MGGRFDRRDPDIGVAQFVSQRLSALADPAKAGPMAAYMKTDMPFWGVQKPERVAVIRDMKKRFRFADRDAYERAVLSVWRLPHREEKYLAIGLARSHKQHIVWESLPLYERMIREGAWWDLVDGVASTLVGHVVARDPTRAWPLMDRWIDDPDMWIRRTAIICQLKHKERTDRRRLFGFCLRRATETEFFIRKAIGWALRQYSYTEPERVRDFLQENRSRLSNLSYREGSIALVRAGAM